MPKLVEVDIESISPYSQSRQHETPKIDKETPDAWEQRTWREKCSVNDDGVIVIPAMAMKQALDAVAKRLGDQIPGKGKATYTKHFVGGVICESDISLGVRKIDVPSIRLSQNADGVRGSGKRVFRIFPQIAAWAATASFAVLDDTVTPEVFQRHFLESGRFVGIGRFRPEKGGLNGCYRPLRYRWSDI